MKKFEEYVKTRIDELSSEAKKLSENYRQDDAVFAKIKINVYDICKTVFKVFEKTKPADSFFEEYIKKLDEFQETWSSSAKKAESFGDSKKAAVEEAKLFALAEIKEKFIEFRGE